MQSLTPELVKEFEELITHYPEKRAGLIPALHRCQEELGGHLTPEIMEDCAEFFGLEPVEVFGVASFYPMFRFSKPGKHVVNVCHNISCALRGAEDLISKVCEVTGAPDGGKSEDGKFSVQRVECQGACASAPMFEIGGEYYENLDLARAEQILKGL
ncbi:MAG: NAD(P)H-dependent oxidoreductase subunit E [Planctomycetota bacterium]